MRIQEFTYDLPETRIAKYPLQERDASKLLLYRDGTISEDTFSNLPRYLPEGALMVLNNTRVIRARLHFHKDTGAHIEIFCLEPLSPHDYQQNFAATGHCAWSCLIGNAKKWKSGTVSTTLQVAGRTLTLVAERGEAVGSGFGIHFAWDDDTVTFAEVLEACGELPIPPYLNRQTEESDLKTYQTVYSRIKGSVAAPTAGLHFTERVFAALDARHIEREEVTLHVGAGTFKPVKTDTVEAHEMHAEWISVRRTTLVSLLAHEGACIAVGTTSVRTLESLYYLGEMVSRDPSLSPDTLHIAQWLPYDAHSGKLTTMEALQSLLDYMDTHHLDTLHATTQIIITPGYKYHLVREMITNFHQPQSTLLLLVSAFIGDDWKRVYTYALSHDFRFLSYGDSSLLQPGRATP